MGIFSFLAGNYKPSDFANKTLEQIFKEIKLDKVDKSIQQDAEFNALPEETKSAIQMLIDLKEGKNIIYDKCYKGKGAAAPHRPAPASFHASTASLPKLSPRMNRPGSIPKALPRPVPAAVPVPVPAPSAPVEEEEEEKKEESQAGGGRRRRKTGKKGKYAKSKRSGKKSKRNRRKY